MTIATVFSSNFLGRGGLQGIYCVSQVTFRVIDSLGGQAKVTFSSLACLQMSLHGLFV
jgi:hypothetical protein